MQQLLEKPVGYKNSSKRRIQVLRKITENVKAATGWSCDMAKSKARPNKEDDHSVVYAEDFGLTSEELERVYYYTRHLDPMYSDEGRGKKSAPKG
jgi:hypothetical protein